MVVSAEPSGCRRFERDGARGVDVLVDEVGRDLQRGGVVVEVALDVVVRQPRRRVDVEPEQVADGVRVLAAIQATQRDASRCRRRLRGVSISVSSQDTSPATVCASGRGSPAGGIRPPRSLRIAASQVSAFAATWSGERFSNERPPACSAKLWHSKQYFLTTAHSCCFDGA